MDTPVSGTVNYFVFQLCISKDGATGCSEILSDVKYA